jgi:predicted nucleotidyltransferase
MNKAPAETAALDITLESALAFLRQRIQIEAAYLFGSQLEGNTHPYSDIDLAVFSPDVENMRFMARVRLGSELARECQPDVELHLYSSQALANARPTNFAGYIVTHGKRLI